MLKFTSKNWSAELNKMDILFFAKEILKHLLNSVIENREPEPIVWKENFPDFIEALKTDRLAIDGRKFKITLENIRLKLIEIQ